MSGGNGLLKNVKHPFLVGLHYSFQTADKLYFVLDYINGGEVRPATLSSFASFASISIASTEETLNNNNNNSSNNNNNNSVCYTALLDDSPEPSWVDDLWCFVAQQILFSSC